MPKKRSGATRFVNPPPEEFDRGTLHQPRGVAVHYGEGRLTVTILDASHPDGKQLLDCSRWLSVPKLALAFADVLPRILTKRAAPRSRYGFVVVMANGFFRYCGNLEGGVSLGVEDLTQDLVDRFFESLYAPPPGGESMSAQTVMHYASALRAVIKGLQGSGASVSPDLIVRAVDVTRLRATTGTETLTRDVFGRLIAVSRHQALEIMRRVQADWKAAERYEKRERVRNPIGQVIAMARSRYTVLPERRSLKLSDPDLFALIVKFGYSRVRRALHPQPPEFTPFVYYLACMTLYNGQPLMEIKLTDIAEVSLFGVDRTSLRPFKTRGMLRQHRSFASTGEADSPGSIIAFLKEWTSRIRPLAHASVRDNLFIAVNKWREDGGGVVPLYDRAGGWSRYFNKSSQIFCQRHGFRYIGLRAIRTTGAEVSNELFDSDPVVTETLLGHADTSQTHRSYRSPEVVRRGEERLLGAIAARERWIASSGKSDARTESARFDRTAATPGFRCVDPFASPIAGQRAGRLCSAFGFCCDCPLAQPSEDSSYFVARLLQLRERLNEAKVLHGSAVWEKRFADLLSAVDTVWLPHFATPEALKSAGRLNLNPLPMVD